MAVAHSPLRYPGGKQVLYRVLAHLITTNDAEGGTYAEPYAGGGGAAIALLYGGYVRRVLINDADPCVYAFWSAMLSKSEQFLELLRTTPVTIREWVKQRDIYRHPKRHSTLRVGFATFYLNRCNRSGIIGNGGPIGGRHQSGPWRIDARFNRVELERRIRKILLYRDSISVSNLDAIEFLRRKVAPLAKKDRPFVYLDPPYYAKGESLYLNHYGPADHAQLAAHVKGRLRFPWVMSYDNVPEIRKLYRSLRQVRFDLDYTARERRRGSELLIFKRALVFPAAWSRGIPKQMISVGSSPEIRAAS